MPSELTLARLAAHSYGTDRRPLPAGVTVLAQGFVDHVQYVIYDHPAAVILAYPGTNEIADWRRHFRFLRVPLPPHLQNLTGPRLGYHVAWQTDARSTEHKVNHALAAGYKLHDKRLMFIGHSYGGPLAAWMAYRYRVKWPNARLTLRTYGSPAPADRDLAVAFAALLPDAIRYANPLDPVTRVPFTGHHLGTLRRLPPHWPPHSMSTYLRAIA